MDGVVGVVGVTSVLVVPLVAVVGITGADEGRCRLKVTPSECVDDVVAVVISPINNANRVKVEVETGLYIYVHGNAHTLVNFRHHYKWDKRRILCAM